MTDEKDDASNGHDSGDTPPGGIRLVSEPARALADLALALNSISHDCATASRAIDGLGGIERAAYLEVLGRRLGQLGDLAHEARRALKYL